MVAPAEIPLASRRFRRSTSAVAAAVLLTFASAIAVASSTTTVTAATEAWYLGPGSLPEQIGEGPLTGLPAANPYRAGTLHVGISGGAENARTYIKLDASSLGDAPIARAKLVLPIDEGDGTVAPETAQIEVCFAPDPGPAADGSLSAPPPVDCSASSLAEYRAEPVPHFVADLAPLGYEPTVRTGGFAILPAAVARTQNATWHVAFFTASTAPSPADAIHADVELAARPAASTVAVPPSAPLGDTAAGPVGGEDDRPAFAELPLADFVAAEAATPAPLLQDAPLAAQPAFAQAPVGDGGFAYSIVLVLPLLLLAALGVTASALTKPPAIRRVTVVEQDKTD